MPAFSNGLPAAPFCRTSSSESICPAAQAEALIRKLYKTHAPADPSTVSRIVSLVNTSIADSNVRGQALLGVLHRDGLGVSVDTERAETLLRGSAQAGDSLAQATLGRFLLDRLQAADEKQSVKGEELVLEQDDEGKVHARVALTLEDGQDLKEQPSPAKMVRELRKARRKAGFSDQQALEFEEYKAMEEEKKKRREREEALQWLEKAAEQGDAQAMVAVANEVLKERPTRAVQLYERAAKEGRDTDAYYNLGQIYTEGIEGIEPDQQKASLNFSMAAQLGDSSAQFYLGHLYRVGSEYVKSDAASARQYIEMAAEQKHAAAVYYLALMHRNGEGGLEANQGAFRRYVSEAASLGHGPAHACLGDMYYKGTDGVDFDYKKALEHFTEAGKLGENDALCSAAAMHFHGLGTPKDHHQAFLLYQKAVEHGSIPALRNIGSMYYHGQGVPTNKKIAAHFYKMADEGEAKKFEDEEELRKNTPIKTTDAPKHPMADIPRNVVDYDGDFEELAMQEETKKEDVGSK